MTIVAPHETLGSKKSMANAAWAMFWVAFGSIILTAAGVFLIWRTLVYTRKAAVAADGAVTEARNATAAAQDSVRAADETLAVTQALTKAQLRPYVHVKTIDLNRVFDTETNELIVIELYIVWLNSGQTPTRRLVSDVNWRIFEGSDIPAAFDFPNSHTERGAKDAAIGPSQEFRSVLIIPAEIFNQTLARTHCLYYWGWIEYNDALGGKRHRTETCSRIDVYTDPGAERPHVALTLHTKFNGADEDCYRQPA